MRHYADLGDSLICSQFGYLPHESIMESIEIIGKEVLPSRELRAAGDSPMPSSSHLRGPGRG